ncbi:hypothetical protein MCOR25_008524 [Pyricularia grisea]|nr:hypothetical protein MCOR25_008524 [Pyricularia grisea]
MSDARVMLAAAHGGFDMLTTLDSMEHDIGIKEDYQGGWVEYELLYFIFHTSPNKGDTALVHFIMEIVDPWPRRHQWTHWVYPTFEKALLRDAEAVFDTRETVWVCRAMARMHGLKSMLDVLAGLGAAVEDAGLLAPLSVCCPGFSCGVECFLLQEAQFQAAVLR